MKFKVKHTYTSDHWVDMGERKQREEIIILENGITILVCPKEPDRFFRHKTEAFHAAKGKAFTTSLSLEELYKDGIEIEYLPELLLTS